MTRTARRSRLGRNGRSLIRTPSLNDASDADVLDAIRLFTRALARCGASPTEMVQVFTRLCESIPQTLIESGQRAKRELRDAGHLLSVWFTDPLYLDEKGEPLPLPLRGAAPSIAALIEKVNPALDAEYVLNYLLEVRAVVVVEGRYAPRGRVVALRGTGGPTHQQCFRSLLGILRTFESNTRPKDEVPGSFQFVAENPNFPRSAREDFGAKVHQRGMAFLREMDSVMLGYEQNRRPSEPTERMAVAVYVFEEGGEAPPCVPAPRKGPSKRSNRRRAKQQR